jgi:outer membrane receptor protein involved in Fe transport
VLNNGSLSYRFIVKQSSSYNLFVTHRLQLPGNWLHHTNVRLGVNNLFNTEPPLSGDSRGYEPSVYNVMARGRTYALQLTRKF